MQPRLAGCIDAGLLRRKFRDQKPELRCCLLASPPGQPPTLIRIRFAVPCRGLVQEAAIEADPYLTEPVRRCLIRVMETWRFPPGRPGAKVYVTYPLRYVP